jgi:LysM repeat protein
MNGYQYYNNLSMALTKVNSVISQAETDASASDEFATKNHAEILSAIYEFRRQIVRMLNVHKFARLTKEAFIQMQENQIDKRVEKIHTVASFETGIGIASKYGMTLDELLQKNNILSSEVIPGQQLKVEVDPSQGLNKVYDNIPTFGTQEELEILGRDWQSELKADYNGDFVVLDPISTLVQGMINRITTKKGEYPTEPEFGLDDQVGTEIPDDLEQNTLMIRIINQLLQDNRLTDITSIDVTRQQNSILYTIVALAINNKTVTART